MSLSYRLLEPEKHFAVQEDHLPRVARYVDDEGVESRQVLYWGGRFVQTLSESEWTSTREPLPSDPRPEDIQAAIDSLQQSELQSQQEALALRQIVLQEAQSAVGVSFKQLTATQMSALLAPIFWERGILDKNGVVRPLNEWIRP